MRDTRLWERHAYAYEMALVRSMPMIWPMRDARLWGTHLWDGFCEKHAYERHAYLHRLEKGGSLRGRRGVEGGSAGLSRSTRRGITWPNLRRCLSLAGRQPVTPSPVTISKV
jgi:hypothetical protein